MKKKTLSDKNRRSRRRRFQLEILESRRLLAFDLNALRVGLVNDYLPFLAAVQNNDHYRDPLPLIGDYSSGGTQLNGLSSSQLVPLRTVLDGLFVTPFSQFAAERPLASASDVATWLGGIKARPIPGTLQSAISGLRIVESSATSTQSASGTSFDFRLKIERTTQVGLRVESSGQAANSSQFQLDIAPNQLGNTKLQSDISLVLRFGVSDGAVTEFFIDDAPSREVLISHQFKDLPPTAQSSFVGSIGFVGVRGTFENSGLASYHISLSDNWARDPASSSRWSGKTLKEDAIQSIAGFSSNSVDATANWQSQVEPVSLPGIGMLNFAVSTSIVSSTTATTNSQGDFSRIAALSKVSSDTVSAGIESMISAVTKAPKLTSASNNPWRQEIAIVDQSWNELIDLEDQLKAAFVAATRVQYDGQTGQALSRPFLNDAQLLSLLSGLTIASYDANGVVFEIKRSVELLKSIQPQLSFDAHPEIIVPQKFEIPIRIDTDFQFGVRASDGQFFVVPKASPEVRIAPAATTFSLSSSVPGSPGRIGISEATITAGSVQFAGLAADVRLIDPDGFTSPGQILLSDFAMYPVRLIRARSTNEHRRLQRPAPSMRSSRFRRQHRST